MEPFSFVPRNVIYQPTGRESVQYSRYAQLLDGTILATVSLTGHYPAFFPVFKSVDGGLRIQRSRRSVVARLDGIGLGDCSA